MKHNTFGQCAAFNFKTVAVSAALLVLLSACGSNVKLDDVPVTDRTGATVNPTDASSTAGQGSTRTVPAAVMEETAVGQPPASVARVVYFDYDSFIVRPEFAATLEAHSKFLKADAKRRVVLQGHTDERGGREYNLALGQKRAEAVRRQLAILGVSEAQQEAVSFGKENPQPWAATKRRWPKTAALS